MTMLFIVGCGRKDRLGVAPVRGRVVYNNQGVPNTTVILHPAGDVSEKAKKLRPFAYGESDGTFEIKTYVTGDGAPLGDYRVSIIAPVGGGAGIRDKDGGDPAPAAASVSIPRDVAAKFANVETSGLTVTVHEGENKLEPFVLQ